MKQKKPFLRKRTGDPESSRDGRAREQVECTLFIRTAMRAERRGYEAHALLIINKALAET